MWRNSSSGRRPVVEQVDLGVVEEEMIVRFDVHIEMVHDLIDIEEDLELRVQLQLVDVQKYRVLHLLVVVDALHVHVVDSSVSLEQAFRGHVTAAE